MSLVSIRPILYPVHFPSIASIDHILCRVWVILVSPKVASLLSNYEGKRET